jgi:two-component system, NarL family, response regulator LiaR
LVIVIDDRRAIAMVGNQTNQESAGLEVHEPMRVIIADDDPFARRMIKESLQRAGVVVVAEAPDGRQAVELAVFYRPDVVLMDVVMPELDGISATRQIVEAMPDQLVVMLTSSDEDEMGFVGLRAGAVGYLSKDLDVDILPQALDGAVKGEAAISRRLSMKLIEQLRRAPEVSTGMRPVKSPLTAREWEVVDLLYEGRTTDEIADMLVLSTETVRSHIKNLMKKLGARSRAEAVELAHRSRVGGQPPG